MIFIPKAGSKEVRPISLSNSLLKLFERVIYSRLEWWCENNLILPSFQFGFRKNKSTSDNLAILSTFISDAFLRKMKVGAIFLDIKGAFDNVDANVLKEILQQLQLPQKIIKFLHFLVAGRHVEGYFDGSSLGRRRTNKGLPQGSVLSPILYCIYTAFISADLEDEIRLLAYADDVVVFCKSGSIGHIYKILNKALATLGENFDSLGLSVSGMKSKFCIFSDKGHIHNSNLIAKYNLSLSFKGSPILLVKEVRFLGVVFDDKFSWLAHAKYVRGKCKAKINVLKSLCGLTWGAHPSSMLSIYKGWIRSALDYGCMAFIDLSPRVALILDRIQFSALRVAFSLMSTTPSNVILHLAGEMPLSCRSNMLVGRYLLNAYGTESHMLRNMLIKMDKYLQVVVRPFVPSILSVFRSLSVLNVKSIISNRLPGFLDYNYFSRFAPVEARSDLGLELREILKEGADPGSLSEVESVRAPPTVDEILRRLLAERKLDNFIKIFTDRSKVRDRGVGCAFVSTDLDVQKRYILHQENSVFDAEAIAILMALEYISHSQQERKFIIATDSLSIIIALSTDENRLARSHHWIIMIKDVLYTLTEEGFIIVFVWIPGHVGIEGNESADREAKLAALDLQGVHSSELRDEKILLPRNFYEYLKIEATKESLSLMRIDAITKGYRYFNRIKFKDLAVWYRKYNNLSRSTISLISRFRSFHVHLRQHLSQKGIIDSPLCPCGQDEQTIEHLLLCVNNEQAADWLRTGLFLAGSQHSPATFKLEDIIFSDIHTEWKLLEQFCNKIGVKP